MSSYHIEILIISFRLQFICTREQRSQAHESLHFFTSPWALSSRKLFLSIIFHIVSSRRFLLCSWCLSEKRKMMKFTNTYRGCVWWEKCSYETTRVHAVHLMNETWWCLYRLYLYEYFKWRTTFKSRRKKLGWGHKPHFKLNSSSDRHQLAYLQIVIWGRVERREKSNFYR